VLQNCTSLLGTGARWRPLCLILVGCCGAGRACKHVGDEEGLALSVLAVGELVERVGFASKMPWKAKF
jgi:hypothetical protein